MPLRLGGAATSKYYAQLRIFRLGTQNWSLSILLFHLDLIPWPEPDVSRHMDNDRFLTAFRRRTEATRLPQVAHSRNALALVYSQPENFVIGGPEHRDRGFVKNVYCDRILVQTLKDFMPI